MPSQEAVECSYRQQAAAGFEHENDPAALGTGIGLGNNGSTAASNPNAPQKAQINGKGGGRIFPTSSRRLTMETFEQQGHDSVAVANRFIAIARGNGVPICSLTKLIKLVYIAHGYYLALRDRNLIRDEVQAWQYGPVIPRVHQAFKRFPALPEPLEEKPTNSEELDADSLGIIESVYNNYGRFNYHKLLQITHKQDTPWYIVHQREGNKGGVIETGLIQEYYYNLLENSGSD